MNLTDDEIKKISKSTAEYTIKHLFERLDIDISDDVHVIELRKDLEYARKARVGSDKVADWIKRSIILTGVSGLVYIIVEGIRTFIRYQ